MTAAESHVPRRRQVDPVPGHQFDVYAVASGRLVQAISIDGSSQGTCLPVTFVRKGTTATSQNTPPGDAEYTAALDQLINGLAVG